MSSVHALLMRSTLKDDVTRIEEGLAIQFAHVPCGECGELGQVYSINAQKRRNSS